MKQAKYEVNPHAEVVGDVVAKTILNIAIICSIIGVIAGIIVCGSVNGGIGVGVILSSVFLLFIGIINWAMLKIFVNISRNLYNVNDALRKSTNINSAITVEPLKSAQFQKGQLVIIKETENQFRIDDVIEEEGEFMYFSNKLNTSFTASEIEDFNTYWKNVDFKFKVGDVVIYPPTRRIMTIKSITVQGIECFSINKKGREEFEGIYKEEQIEPYRGE